MKTDKLIFLALFMMLIMNPFTISAREKVKGDASMHTIDKESFTYQYLTTKEGLSNQRVFSILEDNQRLIWVSTRSGVDSFDGRNVKNYSLFGKSIIEDESGRMIYLIKDFQDSLWAYTNSGKIFKYDINNDKFNLRLDINKLIQADSFLSSLYIDKDGKFWVGLKDGLFVYSEEDGVDKILDNEIHDIEYSVISNKFYISTIDGLYSYDIFSKIKHTILPNINIQSTFFDKKTSLLWIGTFNKGIELFDIQANKFIKTKALDFLPSLPYRDIIEYDGKTLLLGVDGGGVYAVRRDASVSWNIFNSNQEKGGVLNGNGIYTLYKDSFSNVWIGSYTGGVTYANPKRYFFDLIHHKRNDEQSLINDHVNAILEDVDGDIWYATNQGISVHFMQTNTWKHFLKENVFLALCDAGAGEVYAGGYATGLYCLNKYDGIRKHITTANSNYLTTDYIYSIYKDDKCLWIGGMYGKLMRFSPKARALEQFETYNITHINSIVSKNKDTLAIASVNGFYLLDKKTGFFRQYFQSPTNAGTRSNSFIYSMYFPSRNKVWFGTDGGGINLFDLKTLKARTYSTEDGLPSNYVYSILPDSQGHIWVSTDKGLAYMTMTSSPEVTNIGFLDGLANEFNFMSFARLKSGDFIYGSTNGAVRFNPKNFTKQIYEAPLIFNTFEAPQKTRSLTKQKDPLFNTMLKKGKDIELKYYENSFYLSYISISYQFQKDIVYKYRLKGFDEHWSDPTIESNIRYTNIPPGDYTFQVKSFSKNNNLVLDENELHIHISLPIWNTTMAWIIYILLILGFIYFIWDFYTSKLEKKHFADKIQFFINTAHDIRTPVTLIMAPLGDLTKEQGLSEEGKKNLQIAQHSTKKLYNLISQLLTFQKIDTQHLSLQVMKYDFNMYIQDKVIFFQPLCERKNITINLNLPEETIYLWTDKEKCDKIFDNLFSNAVKYSKKGGLINITVAQTDKKIEVEIKDNGIGIPRKAQRYIFSNFYRAENAVNSKETGSGIGLLLTRHLIKLLKANISFTSVEGEGTTFSVSFRKGYRHLSKYIVDNEIKTDDISPELLTNNIVEDINGKLIRNHASIMIVEDNDELRYYLKKTFSHSYSVIDKPDGESALLYLKEKSVDLIISDVMMPGIQGDELCRKIKKDFTTSHIPVILLTAKADKNAVLLGLKSGADDYLTKPFDSEILKTKIKGVLHNREVMRRYFRSHHENLNMDYSNMCSPMDKEFLDHCNKLVKDNLENPEFTITKLCRELAMSRTLFYEKLKALTGQSPNEFIKEIKMETAASLLKQHLSVQEVAFQVGFTDSKYFSTVFKRHFGISPSKYI